MLHVTLSGVHPQLDGAYPLDGTAFTNRELRMVKQMSGVRAAELAEAFQAGDNDLLVAFAAIALRRAGKQFVDDVLWEAAGGSITFDDPEEAEDDARPPAEPTAESNGASSAHSGDGSSNGGEPSPETLSPSLSGTPG